MSVSTINSTTSTQSIQTASVSTSMLSLPDELLLAIFHRIQNLKDLPSFARVCKKFHEITQMPEAWNFPELVPSYISNTTDLSIQELPTWKKVQLAKQIEKNLLTKDRLPIIFNLMDLPYGFSPYVKTIIGDYFIHIPRRDYYTPTAVHVHHLKTRNEKFFQAHQNSIETCAAIQTPSPFLVTINEEEGFKIWDLDCLMGRTVGNCLVFQFHDTTTAIAKSNFDCPYSNRLIPVIKTHRHLLGVGYQDHVSIWDCSNPSSPQFVTLQFSGVKQIQFSSTHLMLASDNHVAIWDLSALKDMQNLKLESASYTYSLKDGGYLEKRHSRQASLVAMQNDKIFTAYKKGFVDHIQKDGNIVEYDRNIHDFDFSEHFVVGEVRNWKTNEHLRWLSFPSGTKGNCHFNAVDFLGRFMFSGSTHQNSWDLESTNNSTVNPFHWSFDDHQINKVYALGHHVLFADVHELKIYEGFKLHGLRNDQKGPVVRRDAKMEVLAPYSPLNDFKKLCSLDIDGKYLVAERKAFISATITIFDLNPNH